jgi:hypothetical protein
MSMKTAIICLSWGVQAQGDDTFDDSGDSLLLLTLILRMSMTTTEVVTIVVVGKEW